MKTIVKFKALVPTRVRNEAGVKIKVAKGRTFTTNENYADNYKKYTRLFEFIEIIPVEKVKKDKNKVKNSDAFPVTISEEMTNAEVEKILTKMGAKFKKKDKRENLVKAYETKLEEIEAEKQEKIIEAGTEKFKKMVDNRTIDQLQDFVEDIDKALDVENIDKEACEEYILEVLEKKIEDAKDKKVGDDEGNSEGSLDGADA